MRQIVLKTHCIKSDESCRSHQKSGSNSLKDAKVFTVSVTAAFDLLKEDVKTGEPKQRDNSSKIR